MAIGGSEEQRHSVERRGLGCAGANHTKGNHMKTQDILNKSGSALGLASAGFGRLPSGLHFQHDGNSAGGGAGGATTTADDEGTAGGGTGEGDGDTSAGDDKPVYTSKAYAQVLSEAKAAKKRAQDAEKKLAEAARNAVPPEELEALREFKNKQAEEAEKREKDKGEFDKILERTKSSAAEREKALLGERDGWKVKFQNTAINNVLAMHIPQFTTAAPADVMAILRPHFKIDEETDEIYVEVNGVTPKNEKTGHDMTPEEFIESEIAKRPYFASARPANGSGGGTRKESRDANKPKFTREMIQKMSPAEFKLHEKEIIEESNAGRIT